MAATSTSGASLGGGEVGAHGNLSVEASKDEQVPDVNVKSDVKKGDEVQEPPGPPDDSLMVTPKTSPSKGAAAAADSSEESVMNYTPSPTSDHGEKSSPPQVSLNQPVVSHVPASVRQPVLQSEHSSLASPAPAIQPQHQHAEGESAAQQQHPQHVVEEKVSGVPTLMIHGTQGQVVTKRKGRFRLLQDAESTSATNLAAGASSDAVTTGAPQLSSEQGTVVGGVEGVTVGAHPSRERTLSNTSTISAMSVPATAPPPVVPTPSTVLNVVDSPSHPHAAVPVGKKKGRFVVIPGDVTDPSLLRQPFPGNQGVLRQQPLQPPATLTEQAVGNVPQATMVAVSQPAAVVVTQQPILSQDVTQQFVQSSDSSQHYQVSTNAAQHSAGTVQHQMQQVNAPQYYATTPHAQVGTMPPVVHVNYSQQHQVGPPVTAQNQPRTSHSPVPPSNQPNQPLPQQNIQPPAQILFTEQQMLPQPTYVVQTDDGRFHQLVAGPQQQMIPIPEQQSAASGLPHQQAAVSYDTQYQVQPNSGAMPVPPPTATGEAPRPPHVVKPTAVKRPSIQRGTSGAKGGPANVGFGKVFYFLEQMKLEVTEADRTIKNQGRDMKFLRDKNKELEARSRDMERKYLEEKAAREALETKVKSLRKRVKDSKGHHDANEGDKKINEAEKKVKAADDAHDNVTDPGKSQLRSNSVDEAENTAENEKPKPSNSGVVSHSAPSESKEAGSATGAKPTTQPRSSKPTVTKMQSKPTSPLKPAVIPASVGPTVSSDSKSAQPSKPQSVPEVSKLANAGSEVSRATAGDRETVPVAPSDKLSPPRRRVSKDVPANKIAGKSHSARSLVVPTIDGPSGQATSKQVVTSSGDSLGSASEFDPLRVAHGASSGDGAMSTTSEPVSMGHQATLSSGSSVISFVTAPAPMQTVGFDPLSANLQSGNVPGNENHVVQGLYSAPSTMQPSPQHNHSQSMPNFIVQPNSMMMAYPVQQIQNVSSSTSLSQLPQGGGGGGGWNQQQPVVSQNQYLPTQYSGMATPNLQSQQQQFLHSQVPLPQQQQQEPKVNAQGTDPFDELASRRAPAGTSGAQ